MLALREAAWDIAFEKVQENNDESEVDVEKLKERIAKLRLRTNLFNVRD